MASCPTVKVTNIKTGETLVINESDFDSTLYIRGSVAKGAGVKASVPSISKFKSKSIRSRKDNT
jgi:hypothetical protein